MKNCIKTEGRYDLSFIASEFSPDETGRITRMLIARNDLSDNGYEVFKENAKALREDDQRPTGTASFDDIQALINKKSNK